MNIEEVAAKDPDAIILTVIDPSKGITKADTDSIISKLGIQDVTNAAE